MSKIKKISNQLERDQLVSYLNDKVYPDGYDRLQKKRFRLKCKSFLMINGHLCHKSNDGTIKRAIFDFEELLVQMILSGEHNMGHPGMNKMISFIHSKYYGISTDVIRKFVAGCSSCSKYNNLSTLNETHINIISHKYERYIMDCVDLRKYAIVNDGYGWVLNVIDTYTKYLFSYKMYEKSAESVKMCLEHIYSNFGMPQAIQADNGKEFRNELLKEFHMKLNITVIHGRPRNPQAQGQVERVNQTIKRWMAKTLETSEIKRWIDIHQDVVHVYNRSVHRATNKTPFFLFHGQNGFNTRPAIEENEDIENLTSEESNSEYDFDLIDDTDGSNDNRLVFNEVFDHFFNYRETVILNANSNNVRNNLKIGNKVYIKQDFDNNILTRRNPFDSFVHSDQFEVIEFLNNNMIKLKNLRSGEFTNVFKTRLKKINN